MKEWKDRWIDVLMYDFLMAYVSSFDHAFTFF